MIGRGALGNPWMLYRTVQYLETGKILEDPTPREKIDVAMLHLDRLIALKGENVAVREMRKHAAWYLKGIRGNGTIRNKVNETNTRNGVAELLYGFIEELEAKQAV